MNEVGLAELSIGNGVAGRRRKHGDRDEGDGSAERRNLA
jgi:hypothetical protein